MSSLTSSTFAKAKTYVLWDMEDCPIPDGFNPGSISWNIRLALKNKGYHGEMEIIAYGDKNQIPGYFEHFKINLVRTGNKHARVEQMKLDFYHLTTDNPEPSNVMLISRNKMDLLASSLRDGKVRNYDLLVAQPEDAPGKCYNCSLVDELITEE